MIQKVKTAVVGCGMIIDEIASSDEIELVVNLTPAYSHYDIIKKMLLAGKHVWTEKTMTVTVDQARELADVADEKGLYLGVAPDTVLGAGLQTARRAIETDMIGRVTSGIAVVNRNQVLNSEYYTFLRGNGGSLPYDVGVYYISALQMAYAIRTGRPNRCSKEYGLHCLEVLSGLEEAVATGRTVEPSSRFEMKSLAPGYYSTFMGGMGRADAEKSLIA